MADIEHLAPALEYAENMISTARVSSSLPTSDFGDEYLGWVSWSHPEGNTDGREVPLFESYCWRYVTRMLRAMRENEEVYTDPTYRERYDAILAFSEEHMFEKWMSRGESNLYRSRTHMASHWGFIALDLYLLTADDDRREQYWEVFDNLNQDLPNYASSMRQQLMPHPSDPDAFFWSSEWGSTDAPGQDVAHGNAVVSYMVEASDHGCEYTRDDMQKMVGVLDRVIWRGPGDAAEFVDGSGNGTGWFNDGFIKLGRYDAGLQARLESDAIARNMQHYGALAHNAKILEGSAAPSPQCGLIGSEPTPPQGETGEDPQPSGSDGPAPGSDGDSSAGDSMGDSDDGAPPRGDSDSAANDGLGDETGGESDGGTGGSGASTIEGDRGCSAAGRGPPGPAGALLLLVIAAIRPRRFGVAPRSLSACTDSAAHPVCNVDDVGNASGTSKVREEAMPCTRGNHRRASRGIAGGVAVGLASCGADDSDAQGSSNLGNGRATVSCSPRSRTSG